MFHFPASTPTQTMHSPAGNTTQPVLGFPIRTSSDQRFVGNSPRHNAASHVLHRLSMPRHPPYALKKHTQNTKRNTPHTHTPTGMHAHVSMLASTLQFSHTTPTHNHPHNMSSHTQATRNTHKQHLCQRPRHPTACQLQNTFWLRTHQHETRASNPPVCLHPDFSSTGSSCTHGNINHHTQPPTNTKRPCTTKNSLERR